MSCNKLKFVFLSAVVVSALGDGQARCHGQDASECKATALAADDRVGAVAMLQTNAQSSGGRTLASVHAHHTASSGVKHRRQLPNATTVWEQVKGAVAISDIKAQILNATEGETLDSLKSTLTSLQEEFPSASEVKAEFADQWSTLTTGVHMEDVQRQLEAAQDSEQVQQLQAQVDRLYAQMQNVSLDSLQNTTAVYWGKMKDIGFPLPDVDYVTDYVTDIAQDAYDSASETASNAYSSASSAVSGAVGNISDTLGNWWR